MDTFTPEKRSAVMRQIRGRDTRPELLVRRALHAAGLRYRLHNTQLPGKPDITLPRHRAVVLINGCFWHGHADCGGGRRPKSRSEYWEVKLQRNIERDARNVRLLEAMGWRCFVVWECETLRLAALVPGLVERIRNG